MSASYFMLKMIRKKQNFTTRNEGNLSNVSQTGNKCRICLKNGFIPIYGDQSPPSLPDEIRTFGDVEIDENDDLPKHICESCRSLLNSAVLFRKSAKESDLILRATPIVNDDNFSIPDIEQISNHSDNLQVQNTNNDQHKYNCKLCNKTFRYIKELRTHKASKHNKKVRIQCTECQRLVTPQLYKRHLLRHQSASHLICDVCGKVYRKDNLIRHMQLHSFELPFQCQQCPYRGRFMESLKIHMRTHSGDKPFSCDKCELRFITRSNLNRHLLTHKKEKPHKCFECGRGFYTKRDMEVHFKSDHVGIKDFSCRICGNKYGTKKAIMRHELRVHKRDKMAKGRMPLYLQEEYKISS